MAKLRGSNNLCCVGTWFAPPSTPDFLGMVGLNLAWLRPVVVVRLHDGDLDAVGWGESPWALVTPVKAITVGVGLKNYGRFKLDTWLATYDQRAFSEYPE